jgi:DNA-binding MarR family transcriptional regulator
MQVDPHHETTDLVDAILTASRAFVGMAARSLAQVDDTISLAQYRVLVVIASRGPQRLADLAEQLGITSPSATRLCDRLVHAELILRRHSPADRREVQLSLTPKGRALVDQVTAARLREIEHLVEAIRPELRHDMVEALRLFAHAADEPSDLTWDERWNH